MRDIRFAAKIIGKFKSIQSAIFAVVTVLLLSAVLVITGVSMRYTRNSIFENSAVYTQNIVQQMNQNIDSYIDYMENIAYMISSNEDVQQYLLATMWTMEQESACSISSRLFWTDEVISEILGSLEVMDGS